MHWRRRWPLWLPLVVAATVLFCSSPGVQVDIRVTDDRTAAADESSSSDVGPAQPIGSGSLYVVDDEGRLVGLVVARTHRLLEDNELFDGVQVFHPEYHLFFSIRMATAQVLLPGKLFFSGSSCTGTAAIRALCPECRSGYDLAFAYHGTWYRVPGGQERSQFKYSSYVSDEVDSPCTGHGNSSTYVYSLDPLGPGENPGEFTPPLRFVWGN